MQHEQYGISITTEVKVFAMLLTLYIITLQYTLYSDGNTRPSCTLTTVQGCTSSVKCWYRYTEQCLAGFSWSVCMALRQRQACPVFCRDTTDTSNSWCSHHSQLLKMNLLQVQIYTTYTLKTGERRWKFGEGEKGEGWWWKEQIQLGKRRQPEVVTLDLMQVNFLVVPAWHNGSVPSKDFQSLLGLLAWEHTSATVCFDMGAKTSVTV